MVESRRGAGKLPALAGSSGPETKCAQFSAVPRSWGMRTLAAFVLVTLAACQGGGNGPETTPDGGTSVDAAPVPVDGTSCTPTTCAARGAECGTLSDGCGHDLDCGYCVYASDRCESNACVCQPSCYMRDCGDDGCGGSCGACGANEACSTYGRCVYEGAGSTPPAAWVCNDSYWDAGDGCDCNCGALDPDCGEAGQTLHGCTGLAQPTCDPQGLCTGGGACHAVPGSAYLTHYMVIQTPPAMFGGSVVPGRYEATEMRSYNQPGGVSGYGGGDAVAIEISGSTWKRMRRPVGGYPAVDETFTATASGTTVTLARTCPSTLTETYTYTASATQLVLSKASSGGTKVITFTRRW